MGLCDDDESECTKLEKEITVKIVSLIETENTFGCEFTWAVDFYKDHCGGGPSGQMSYIHTGCYEDDDGNEWIRREGIGTWDVTFKYEEDWLNVNLVESNSKITTSSASGKRIYERTYGGTIPLVIYCFVEADGTRKIDISSNPL